jgi:hypothetical protein
VAWSAGAKSNWREKRAYQEEHLKSQPSGRTNAVYDHIGRKLKHHDAERHELLARIELVLSDADVFHEVVRESVGYIALVELFVSCQ